MANRPKAAPKKKARRESRAIAAYDNAFMIIPDPTHPDGYKISGSPLTVNRNDLVAWYTVEGEWSITNWVLVEFSKGGRPRSSKLVPSPVEHSPGRKSARPGKPAVAKAPGRYVGGREKYEFDAVPGSPLDGGEDTLTVSGVLIIK